MCGIVGYIGAGLSRAHILEGLARLEYRGYDAGGFGCLSKDDQSLVYFKAQGGIDRLIEKLEQFPVDGSIGIGHMRWSTHGLASDPANAHPHADCGRKISLVHNGIVENHHDLRTMLEQTGHVFESQTDTETIAHLLESLLLTHSTHRSALIDLVTYLEGAYAFACIAQDIPDTLIVARRRSPLCIGIGDDEMFVASDSAAFAGKTYKVLFMPDESFAFVKKNRIELYNFAGQALPLEVEEHVFQVSVTGKNGYEHFMLKEIYDQKKIMYDTVNFTTQLSKSSLWEQMGLLSSDIVDLEALHLVGCGTSWHAARIGQFFFEQIAHVPTNVHLASDFRFGTFFPEKKSIYVGVSQSGETADTLEALRLVYQSQIPTIALTNVASSTIVREATGFLLTHAGPEIAVASTKVFSAQVAMLFLLAHHMALEKGNITPRQLEVAHEDLLVVAEVLENTLESYKRQIVATDAPFYATFTNFILLGRHISYPFALEAALKLKQIAYLFVECHPAGELKHGPLALVDPNIPVFLFSCLDKVIYQKIVSNAQELKARQGHLVAFAFQGQHELIDLADKAFIIPPVNPLLGPLAMTALVQFFVYQIAHVLGRPIDRPRNLAKAVTV